MLNTSTTFPYPLTALHLLHDQVPATTTPSTILAVIVMSLAIVGSLHSWQLTVSIIGTSSNATQPSGV
jgi:hypothetical protein